MGIMFFLNWTIFSGYNVLWPVSMVGNQVSWQLVLLKKLLNQTLFHLLYFYHNSPNVSSTVSNVHGMLCGNVMYCLLLSSVPVVQGEAGTNTGC